MAPTPEELGRLVKFEVHENRGEGVSYPDFVKFINETWLAAATPLLQRHNVIHFSLTFCDPEERQELRDLLQTAGLGEKLPVTQYDCVSTYYLEDWHSLFAMQADPDWQENVAKMQAPWVSTAPGFVVIGHEMACISSGKAIWSKSN